MLSPPDDGGDASVRDIGPKSHCCAAQERSGHRLSAEYWGRLFVTLLALAVLPATSRAQIYNESGAMPVRMEIVAACTVSASDLAFGAYASNSPTPAQGQTIIQLVCGAQTTAEVMLDAGAGPGRNTSRRTMEREGPGGGRLDYDLYQDPARTIHWGDRSGVDTLEVQTSGATLAIPVYGTMPGGQRAQDGTYSDTITVSVFY
jgi:spore coat protein U-like protein